MAGWKISNNFIEEVSIKMLSTTGYIQNKNNLANTALYFTTKMEVYSIFSNRYDDFALPPLLVGGGSRSFFFVGLFTFKGGMRCLCSGLG